MDIRWHPFSHSIEDISLPERFTYPFHYHPHPLCVKAAEEVQAYLTEQEAWVEELRKGKMFGVLVVRSEEEGTIGYLAAFSGNLAGGNDHPFFVPPVYDLLKPDGFFRKEEDQITTLNERIRRLEADPNYKSSVRQLGITSARMEQTLVEAKNRLREAKETRDKQRQSPLTEAEAATLIRESQYQKAEYKRLERSLRAEVDKVKAEVGRLTAAIDQAKQERRIRSAALQRLLFSQFRMLNARGETRDLCGIFAPTPQGMPPAGAGECAAPKLLQYAYLHHWKPLAMAEFWWGDSPKTEIRRHGDFYPACKGKCAPILSHMLQGLMVDADPLSEKEGGGQEPTIVYEDTYLVAVNKPAGLLAVPGKGERASVYQWARERYPEATGPLLAHRLDMDTSGLLLIAKSKAIHQRLQAQFKNREIEKRYVAILEGIVPNDAGTISLPLCPDPMDRPRQLVSEVHGKPAITRYQVLGRKADKTYIAFYPHTGRTHQLRVHAAHPLGLGCPILGDVLYGHQADRLYLHAESLAFTHPVTSDRLELRAEAPFDPFIDIEEGGHEE